MIATTYTFGMIKPHILARNQVGKIIERLYAHNFQIINLETRRLTKEEAQELYKEHQCTPKYPGLIHRMTSRPVVLMILEYTGKTFAWKEWKKLIGANNPVNAIPGTLRSEFGTSIYDNAVHGSDSEKNATREINIFFK